MKKVILNQILVFSLLTNTLLQKSLASDLAPSDKSMISTEDASLEHNNTIKMSVADLVAKDISESMLRLLIIAYTFDKTSNQRELMIRTGYDYKYNEMLFNSAFGSMVAEVIVATLVSSYGMGLFAAKANDTISSNAFFGGSLAIPMTTSLSAMLISEYVLNPLEKRREDEVPQQIMNDVKYDAMIEERIQPYISFFGLSVDKTNRLKVAIKKAVYEEYRAIERKSEGSDVSIKISVMDILKQTDPESSEIYNNAKFVFDLLDKNRSSDFKAGVADLLALNIQYAQELLKELERFYRENTNLTEAQKDEFQAALSKLITQIKIAEGIKRRSR